MLKQVLGICSLALLGIPAIAMAHDDEAAQNAVCILVPKSDSEVKGFLRLTQRDGYVEVKGKVRGLKPGEHGFHVHMYGDLSTKDGMAAGGHYNPGGHKHGGPNSPDHHAGDLGNIKAGEDGVAEVDTKAEGVSLSSLLGRSIVVHGAADDLTSQPSGNAGPRVAVGVIGLSAPPMK
jgi:Cu-Zn family superoxide dismutase